MNETGMPSLVLLTSESVPSSEKFLADAFYSVFNEKFDDSESRFVTGDPPAFVWMWDGWYFSVVLFVGSYFDEDADYFSECDRAKLLSEVEEAKDLDGLVQANQGWVGITFHNVFRPDPESITMPIIARALSAFSRSDIALALVDPRSSKIVRLGAREIRLLRKGKYECLFAKTG